MLRLTILILLVSISPLSNARESDEERQHKQAELDYACEQAREIALAPKKLEVYKECIKKFKEGVEY